MKKLTTLFVMLLLAAFLLVLSACDSNDYTTGDNPSTSKDTTKQETTEHEHQWIDATCTAPKTCADCGAKLRIPAGTDEDLDELCCHMKLVIPGKKN